MKKGFMIIILVVIGILGVSVTTYAFISNSQKIKLQIIEKYTFEDKEKIEKEIKIKEGDKISLSKYNGNEIEILKITNDYVQISRKAIKYKKLSGEYPLIVSERIEEEIIEKIKYNEEFSSNINEEDPNGPVYDAPKYYYKLKFTK